MVKASSTPRLPYRNVREQSPAGQAGQKGLVSTEPNRPERREDPAFGSHVSKTGSKSRKASLAEGIPLCTWSFGTCVGQ